MSGEKLIDEPSDLLRLTILLLIVIFGAWVVLNPDVSLPPSDWVNLFDSLGGLTEGL